MRYLVICSVLIVTLGLIDARSMSYATSWCLINSQGATNCGFNSLEQCNVSRSGVGGSCGINPHDESVERSAPTKSRSKLSQAKRKKQTPQVAEESPVYGGGLSIGFGFSGGSGGSRHGGGKPRGSNSGNSLTNTSNTLPPGFR